MTDADNLSAKVLGQITLMQSVVAHLPDIRSMFEFSCRGLSDVNGIRSVEYTLYNEQSTDSEPDEHNENSTYFVTSNRSNKVFACLILRFDDLDKFLPYKPYIQNYCNMLGVVIAEHHQRIANEKIMAELEERVAERTEELSKEIAERKNAEVALKISEEKLKTTLNSIGDAVISTDLDGKITIMNPVAQKLTGFILEEAQGKRLSEVFNIINANTGKKIKNPVESVLNSGEIVELSNNTLLISRNGRKYQIADSAAPIKNTEGEVTGVVLVFRDVTEEYQIIEAREVERKRLLNIISATNSGTFDWNIKSGELIVNERWAEIFGWELDDLQPVTVETWRKSVHPEDLVNVDNFLEQLFNRNIDHFDYSFRQFHKSGGWVWVNARGKVIEWDNYGKPVLMTGIHLDITEKMQYEEQLRFHAKLLDVVGQSVIATDIDGRIIYWNSYAERMYGWTAKEVLNNNILNITPVDEFKERAEEIIRIVKSGKSWSGEFNVKRKDGTSFPALITDTPLYNEQGDLIGMIGVSTDITERKKAEKALLKSEGNYRKLFEMSTDAIFIVEKSTGRYKDANAAAEKLTGYTRSELTGMTTKQLAPDGAANRLKIISTSEYTREFGEVVYVHSDGSKRYAVLSMVPLDENYTFGIAHDITERKQAEKAILESQRLGAIGEMASAVAHDFNNSLQSVFGNLELALLNKNIPPQVYNYLEVVLTAVDDAAARVKMLQRFCGIRREKSKYTLTDLNSIITDVIVQSRPLWKDESEKRGKEIIVESKLTDILKINGNHAELRTVLYNIIRNSIEAMPDGGKILFESLQNDTDVMIRISDTGTGMDEETRKRVFQPFFSTKGFEGGRGLGMSGAYGIIKEHSGVISIPFTKPGKGTVVEISFPAVFDKVEEKSPGAASSFTDKVRILWVDDDDMLRSTAKDIIKHLGHTGDVVKNGKTALDMLYKNNYDIVLTDIGMPGMSGWDLITEIRELNNQIPVAVLTGWESQLTEEEKSNKGLDYILQKPVRIADVQSLIASVMQK